MCNPRKDGVQLFVDVVSAQLRATARYVRTPTRSSTGMFMHVHLTCNMTQTPSSLISAELHTLQVISVVVTHYSVFLC